MMSKNRKESLLLTLLIMLIGSVSFSSCNKKPSAREDFFMFVNSDWIKNNPVPSTEPMWGSFSELADKNRKLLHKILDSVSAIKNSPKGSNAQLIGDFYASGMDSQAIEKTGINYLKPELDKINSIRNSKDVMTVIAHLQRHGIFPLFGIMVDQDARKSDQYALYASQGGLGLPNKDYYFSKDAKSDSIRTGYTAHIARMFQLSGESVGTARTNANTVMNIETGLAGASMGPVELRDPIKTYNKWKTDKFEAEFPNMDWQDYRVEAGLPALETIIISQPDFFKKVNRDLKSLSVDDWKVYLKWHLIHNTAAFLNSDFVTENFNFYSKKIYGIKVLEPRWKRVQRMTDMALGDALGQEYVKVAFSPEAKQKVLAMINNLEDALKDRIDKLDWMSPKTKIAAKQKLNTLMVKIGYPDKWKDYAGLSIDRNSYVRNVMRSDSFEYNRNVGKLGKNVDRTEWMMTPPTINAYYNPTMNEIVFPAGILQPPFFDAKADDALNYGGIGAVIGHELTHGYDDQGRLYDANGNLSNWWTTEDSTNFVKRTEVLVHQFNHYKIDDLNVKGELTLGENIADLGGLTIAYEAFQKSKKDNKNEEKIEGFTPDQRFFIGWARVWRANETPEFLRQLIKNNPHSPSRFRVNGPLSDMPAFYQAFNVKPGDPMMAPDSLRARIW
jgi:putative endopeptidase